MIFDIPIFGKLFLKIIVKFQHGEIKSNSLRKYYKKKYSTSVGLYSYGFCFNKNFNNGGGVEIGRFCSIAKNVHYFGANHPIYSLSSSAIFFNKKLNKYPVKDVSRSNLQIGNDVWIGYGAIITCNCKKIGDGVIIGAGSIVTKDVPDYAIVAGNPARIIKYRFDKKTIDLLKESKWWNLDDYEIMEFYDMFDKPVDFIKKLNKNNGDKI